LLEEDRMSDASDCRAALEIGSLYVKSDGIDFGDDSSAWAHDGECDDPRFAGPGTAMTLLDDDRHADATDCRSAFRQGRIRLAGASTGGETFTNPFFSGGNDTDSINFGDDESDWAFDGECDDPRFTGSGMAAFLGEDDRYHDATDCRNAYAAGDIYLK